MSATAGRIGDLPAEPNVDGQRFLITGGGGYLGRRLCADLLRRGAACVHLFDVREPASYPASIDKSKIKFFKGDIRKKDNVRDAVRGVDGVFHVASYGMSGREQLQRQLIEDINIAGTQNVLDACREFNVRRLVYTSTTNVIFAGRPIVNGDETLPYTPAEDYVDNYSRTKMIAERTVIAANEKGVLHTCAIRPAGIYGEGEERHLPRIMNYIELGLFGFVYGAPECKVEFVYIENLVWSHVLAMHSLSLPSAPAAGQPYFISDNEPINNFEFFRPLLEGLGYSYPSLRLPFSLVYIVAWVIELIHRIVSPVFNFQPLLTRGEVNKTGVTHYFKPDKGKKELGYEPQVTYAEGMARVVKHFRAEGRTADARKSLLTSPLFLVLVAAIILAFVFVYQR